MSRTLVEAVLTIIVCILFCSSLPPPEKDSYSSSLLVCCDLYSIHMHVIQWLILTFIINTLHLFEYLLACAACCPCRSPPIQTSLEL